MEIVRNMKDRTLLLSQNAYLTKVLERFDMINSKPVNTLFPQHFKLSSSQSPTTEEVRSYMSKVPYASGVGCLMYAMICTRPDLAYAISLVSRYMSNPSKIHWLALKWVLQYLK